MQSASSLWRTVDDLRFRFQIKSVHADIKRPSHFQPSPSTAFSRRRLFSFLFSTVAHILAGLLLITTASEVTSPLGVSRLGSPTYIELASPQPPSSVQPRAITNVAKRTAAPRHEGDIAVQTKEPVPVEDQRPQETSPLKQLGNERGTVADGELGKTDGLEVNRLERYLYELRLILANRRIYPALSKRLGETGRVVVKFEIRRNGEIENLTLQSPSEHSRLNDAALKLVASLEKYKPLPAEETRDSLSVQVPIDYVLN